MKRLIAMATTERLFLLTAALLLALVAATVSGTRQGRRWTVGETHEEAPSSCVPLNLSCVRSFFVRGLTPQVGYADSENWMDTFSTKSLEFYKHGLDRVVCNEQCFSNLPNLATFLTFVYFPPCIQHEPAVVLPPCRSLCEAAREEYSRYSVENITQACPTVDRDAVAKSIPLLDHLIFNCSRYIAEGACVPRRIPEMSCNFIPSTHVSHHVHVEYKYNQTGYANASRRTHLLSFEQADAEFSGYGLEAAVNDSECRRNLPNTIFFLLHAYFPGCTPHKDRYSTLTYPCRKSCKATRKELKRVANQEEEVYRSCMSLTIAQALELPIFNCSKYPQSDCVERPKSTNELASCLHKRCKTAIRNNVTGGSFQGKQFAYEARFHNLLRGPYFWSLELEVAHCYFDFANVTLSNDSSLVVIPLSKLRRECDYCSQTEDYFNVTGAEEYLVAGQQITLSTGELVWSLDHTSRKSLVAPTTKVRSDKLIKALRKVACEHKLGVCKNSEQKLYLCPCGVSEQQECPTPCSS